MTNTLGLDGSLDDVEMLLDIQSAFGVTIANEEAAKLYTVGDLFDLLRAKISPDMAARKCATAMAFYRLRRALGEHGISARARPDAKLTALKFAYTKKFVTTLEEKSGLKLPAPALRWTGFIGVLAVLAAIVFSLLLLIIGIGLSYSYWNTDWIGRAMAMLLLGVLPAGLLAIWLDPGCLPQDCATLGALAEKTAQRSFGLLVDQGADRSDHRIWQTLTGVLLHHTADLGEVDITRGTYLLHSTWKAARAEA
jgi:hypothetical protein